MRERNVYWLSAFGVSQYYRGLRKHIVAHTVELLIELGYVRNWRDALREIRIENVPVQLLPEGCTVIDVPDPHAGGGR